MTATPATDHGNEIARHVETDGTIYYTVEAWSGDAYVSARLEEAAQLRIELTNGIKKLERMMKNELS